MANDDILREWLDSTDTAGGSAYVVNRYGEGAPLNPVFSYGRETVEALIEQSCAAQAEEIGRLRAQLYESHYREKYEASKPPCDDCACSFCSDYRAALTQGDPR